MRRRQNTPAYKCIYSLTISLSCVKRLLNEHKLLIRALKLFDICTPETQQINIRHNIFKYLRVCVCVCVCVLVLVYETGQNGCVCVLACVLAIL